MAFIASLVGEIFRHWRAADKKRLLHLAVSNKTKLRTAQLEYSQWLATTPEAVTH
ncbi:hypothetical protein [Calothrix sp. PCC 7507]|uniref:hypothetical protein n=1 Tax=Calothrix sp. PCC 7507 TaxID=99598 RepID=UPI00029ECD0C|nr:hypothetical protein [Calothrix sp. PCC 7507]AFY31385.1 hypothetical protein Cal7507_0905 [Calothrix sp. PCC 7507]